MTDANGITTNYVPSKSKKLHAYDKIREQLIERTLEKYEDFLDGDDIRGDTPIEKVLFVALKCLIDSKSTEYENLLIAKDKDHGDRLLKRFRDEISVLEAGQYPECHSYLSLLIIPQFTIIDLEDDTSRRIDFLITCINTRCPRRKVSQLKPFLRYLIVECDGHEFHEKTKYQAALDKSKDRLATLDNFETFRFTGSEIWKNPMGCAQQITDWAGAGF